MKPIQIKSNSELKETLSEKIVEGATQSFLPLFIKKATLIVKDDDIFEDADCDFERKEKLQSLREELQCQWFGWLRRTHEDDGFVSFSEMPNSMSGDLWSNEIARIVASIINERIGGTLLVDFKLEEFEETTRKFSIKVKKVKNFVSKISINNKETFLLDTSPMW